MLQERLVLVVLVLALTSACSTVYEVRLQSLSADPSGLGVELSHCLESIGLEDWSHKSRYANFLAEEPELVSIWRSPLSGSVLSTSPGAVAWVSRESEQYSVRLVPDPASTSEAAQVFADAVSSCIGVHLPGTNVEVDARDFVDLR